MNECNLLWFGEHLKLKKKEEFITFKVLAEPEGYLQINGSTVRRCGVCLSEIKKLDDAQTVRPCGHEYHRICYDTLGSEVKNETGCVLCYL